MRELVCMCVCVCAMVAHAHTSFENPFIQRTTWCFWLFITFTCVIGYFARSPRMRYGWWWCMWHMNVQLCVHQWLLYNIPQPHVPPHTHTQKKRATILNLLSITSAQTASNMYASKKERHTQKKHTYSTTACKACRNKIELKKGLDE